MIFTGCRLVMPPELKHDMTVCAYRLPDANTLGVVLDGICRSAGIEEAPSGDARQALLDAAAGGLTCPEAENAFALSIIETGGLTPAAVSREKAQAIQSGGILEIVENRNSLDDLGGLDALKAWLMSRKDAFTSRARDFGLPQPKDVLIAGYRVPERACVHGLQRMCWGVRCSGWMLDDCSAVWWVRPNRMCAKC